MSFLAPFRHAPGSFWRALKSHPRWTIATVLVAILFAFVFREVLQFIFLWLGIYGASLLLAIIAAWLMWEVMKKTSTRIKTLGGLFLVGLTVVIAVRGKDIHYDSASYLRFESMRSDIVEVKSPLLTPPGKERLLPLRAIETRARDRMNTAAFPSDPDFVRVGDNGSWTMTIEPKQPWGRFFDPITELMSIPATDSDPDFGADTTAVHFTIGESLLFGRNTDTCVRRSFGPWRFFNYEPGNVTRFPDDSGKMVTVVSLIKWSGWGILGRIFFPWPEFGGVQVIEQGDTNFFGRIIHGCGYWVPPEEISKHPFLRGQNIVPYEVSRFRAASLRFHGGSNAFWDYLAPRWYSRQGDMVIADVPQDMNPLPYSLFFQTSKDAPAKIYQYFCMETRDQQTHGLSASFWYPGDGIGPAYLDPHAQLGERLLGCTSVKDKVLSDRLEFKQEKQSVAEARPYIHLIPDADGVVKPRFFYMTTLVIFSQEKASEGGEVRFGTSGRLYLSLTDARREKVVWVDPDHPEAWDDQLRKELGAKWAEK